MLDLLDWQSRSHVQAQVRGLVEQQDLTAAINLIEEYVAQYGDETLLQAARSAAEAADVDWLGCARTRSRQTIALQHSEKPGAASLVSNWAANGRTVSTSFDSTGVLRAFGTKTSGRNAGRAQHTVIEESR